MTADLGTPDTGWDGEPAKGLLGIADDTVGDAEDELGTCKFGLKQM